MKIRILISFCLAMFLAFQSMGQSSEEWNRKDASGQKYGSWKGFYPEGALRYVGQFEKDMPIDTFYYYYEDGKMKSILIYDEEIADKVVAMHFYQTGDTLAKGPYVKQKKDGIWTTYGDRSVPVERGMYIQDKKNGKWTIYYSNGVVSEVMHFKNDIEDGPYKTFFENGQMRMDAFYLNGALHGQASFYSEEGKKEQVGEYVEGLRDGKWLIYDKNELLVKMLKYKSGVLLNPEGLDSLDYNKDEFRGNKKDYLEFEDLRGKIKYD